MVTINFQESRGGMLYKPPQPGKPPSTCFLCQSVESGPLSGTKPCPPAGAEYKGV